MCTITLVVSPREKVNLRLLQTFDGEAQGTFISFESPAPLFKLLTGKRWELPKLIIGSGPITIRKTARRLGRDLKAVHGDVHALLNTGILNKTEDGRVEFPFDSLHVDFILQAA